MKAKVIGFNFRRGLEHFNFTRLDQGKNGSFGGKRYMDEEVRKIPVIFIHGNSDSALMSNSFSSGWDQSIRVCWDLFLI